MADRWTDETEDALAAEFDRSWRGIKILKCDPERLAREALTFLGDAGLLVQPHTGPTVGICGDRAADVFPNGPTRVCDLPAGHAGWHGAPNPPDASGIPSRMSWTVRDEPLVLLDDAPPLGIGPTLRREWGAPRYHQPGDDIRPCPLADACSDDTHARWVSEWVETGRCGAEYERAGGHERGDRIVRCDMPAGHDGFHCESATESEWPNDQLAPEVLPNGD